MDFKPACTTILDDEETFDKSKHSDRFGQPMAADRIQSISNRRQIPTLPYASTAADHTDHRSTISQSNRHQHKPADIGISRPIESTAERSIRLQSTVASLQVGVSIAEADHSIDDKRFDRCAKMVSLIVKKAMIRNLNAGMASMRDKLVRTRFEEKMKVAWRSQLALAKRDSFKEKYLKMLVKKVSLKIRKCWQILKLRMEIESIQHERLLPSLKGILTDEEIIRSLHHHWLNLVAVNKENKSEATLFGVAKQTITLVEDPIGSPQGNTLDAQSTSLKSQRAKPVADCRGLLETLERVTQSRVVCYFRMLKAAQRVQKIPRPPNKTPRERQQQVRIEHKSMDPSRVALLAVYFGCQKLQSSVSRKLQAAFHAVRRHSAVESYRGFYTNWWKWKASNMQAKHHRQLMVQRSELSEERSLRLQSEDRLTKWMSFASPKVSESYGLLTDRGLQADTYSRPTPKFSVADRQPVPPLLFPSKKSLKQKTLIETCRLGGIKVAPGSPGGRSLEGDRPNSSRSAAMKSTKLLYQEKGSHFHTYNHFRREASATTRELAAKNRWNIQLNLKDCYLLVEETEKTQLAAKQAASQKAGLRQLNKSNLEKNSQDDSLKLDRSPEGGGNRFDRLFRTEKGSLAQCLQTERANTDDNRPGRWRLADSGLENSQLSASKRSNDRQLSFGSFRRKERADSTEKLTLLQLWTDRQQRSRQPV